jgi:hypothetical protein
MARYLSLHSLACLTRQGVEELLARLAPMESGQAAAPAFRFVRAAVNLTEGKMLVEYEAAGREDIEAWFARERFHSDWLLRVELESRQGKLAPPES